MDLKTFFLAIFIAAAFVAWPNLAKLLGIKPGLVPFMVFVVALVILAIMAPKDIAELRTISTKAMIVVFAFAVANGLAICFYANKAADENIQTGIFLVTIFILQIVFAPIADWLINGSVPTLRQAAGLGLAAPAMWLLIKSG